MSLNTSCQNSLFGAMRKHTTHSESQLLVTKIDRIKRMYATEESCSGLPISTPQLLKDFYRVSDGKEPFKKLLEVTYQHKKI